MDLPSGNITLVAHVVIQMRRRVDAQQHALLERLDDGGQAHAFFNQICEACEEPALAKQISPKGEVGGGGEVAQDRLQALAGDLWFLDHQRSAPYRVPAGMLVDFAAMFDKMDPRHIEAVGEARQ
ncbi:hypothetical protein ASG40_10300 [Methylobacterium sp. Leaf399]|nr:hypothetical protein ASG40_10300 [Methylobacterium sp. Leaf399]